ncbi:hypothetical protein PILCRDRAFT_827865 [Piloderma croceum F 1598]|uniref:Uncharacterized protein n=1 Tax=Piloderma croceum (strain F 1598) TaxID=765440 RepID=A0A0C3BBV5_PILCF|nr:hypothetical protein PILCRDRAFT_827865 [Piloderma croceum F 1598]
MVTTRAAVEARFAPYKVAFAVEACYSPMKTPPRDKVTSFDCKQNVLVNMSRI